jgi:predicted Zn finger-like uncharacterized protein
MDLFTRCSNCDTVFRVTTRHLQASGGQVRCGRCEAVFDAFASLTAMPPGEDRALPDTSENRTMRTQAPPASAVTAEVSTREHDAAPAETGLGVGEEEGREPQTGPSPDAEHTEPVALDAAASLYEWEFKPAPNLASNRLWLGLSLLMLLGALVQAGYVFRTEVLVNLPQAKPVYQQVCRWLSCEIELPRLAEQLHIDASDLQLVDPRKPNLVKLTALVRNRARVPVEYPAFELTLTNAREQVVARRVFVPEEYLADGVRKEQGLPGRQELSVNLYLDTGPLQAAGYRIYLFYPS